MPCPKCIAKKPNGTQCKNTTCRQYPYCWIHLKSIDKLQVKTSTIPNAGKGLFYVGKENVKPNQRITKYSSIQIDKEGNPNSDYVLEITKNKFLDSSNPLNYVGRYINDPRKSNNVANTRFTRGTNITYENNRYVVPIYTTRTIKPNDELFINYGRNYNI